jgi:hypothetical protein
MTIKKKVNNQEFKERLDKLTHEINQLKSILIYQYQPEKKKSRESWDNLVEISDEVSQLWVGPSALEEIREQRGG